MGDLYRWIGKARKGAQGRDHCRSLPILDAHGHQTGTWTEVWVARGDVFEPLPEEIASFGDLMEKIDATVSVHTDSAQPSLAPSGMDAESAERRRGRPPLSGR